MTERETKMSGYALCVAETTESGDKKVVSVWVECPAIYTPDWQEDGGFMHDEGWFDFDVSDATPVDDDIYRVALLGGDFVDGKGKIKKIVQILDYNLNEE
jgi:hypothetical protein